MGINELVAILLYFFIGLLIIIAFLPIIFAFRQSRGKGRKVVGEILKDLGIAFMVGSAFKYSILEIDFWVIALIGVVLVSLGAIMKIDEK